jgi:hypothetical protein
MMTVSILSRRTTCGWPKASAARGTYRSRGDCRCRERSGDTIINEFWDWLGLSRSSGFLGDIVLGRAWGSRRSALRALCIISVPRFLSLFLALPPYFYR